MIDLHTHTDESDGTTSPGDLVQEALQAGLEALAITDHDTFAGYDEAAPLAREAGLELLCGIELSTDFHGRTVHLLAYWPEESAGAAFRSWLDDVIAARFERNRLQVARLRELGVNLSLEDAQAYNPRMTGRPHFARALVAKGYAGSIDQAFRLYLGESAPGYVPRRTPPISEAIRTIVANGGIPSLAHPIRLGQRNAGEEKRWVDELVGNGLRAIEAYHSDHSPADIERFSRYAKQFHLLTTGGSDFHGENKPDIQLGVGRGNLHIPRELLDHLRHAS